MTEDAITEIEKWSNSKLSPWRRDALRRLALSDELTSKDHEELLALVKLAAGFKIEPAPPQAVAFKKADYVSSKKEPTVLKTIANVTNVNQLIPNARLDFCPRGMTIVYGRNGSGKSGFVRILRTACRTRIENPAKLKVLGDVYGDVAVTQSADIVIECGNGEKTISWLPGMKATPELMQVAVFDSASAEIYVDGGNQIRFLPFGLALPHRLNSVCLSFREKLENERDAAVGGKSIYTGIAFTKVRDTEAQRFDQGVSAATTDAQINAATSFDENDEARLAGITRLLLADAAAAADLTALAAWADSLADECDVVTTQLSDSELTKLSQTKSAAVAAREAASLSADALFEDEPLAGVASETWRVLWDAARDYSIGEAYPKVDFPVVKTEAGPALCVLCQQPLLHDAAARLLRFKEFVEDAVGKAAVSA